MMGVHAPDQHTLRHSGAAAIGALLFFLLQACAQQQEVRVVPKKAGVPPLKTEIVITAVGDVMMPSSIQASASRYKRGYDVLFEKIAQDLAVADITFANLETPVDQTAASSGYPKFNAPPALLPALKKAGVDIVSVANNHAMDAGPEGLKKTIDNVEAAGLLFTGAGRTKAEAAKIKYMTARGVNVAFLSYTYSTNQRLPRKAAQAPGVNILRNGSDADLGNAMVCVRQAKATADLVVVSLHWGDEYAPDPTPWQRKAASELVEAGADIILGHHPHVLQPIESYAARDGRVALVVYSLGNFISSQSSGVTYEKRTHRKALRGDGILLSIVAVKEMNTTRVDRAEFLPIWTLRDQIGKGTISRPVSIMSELARIEALDRKSKELENTRKLISYRMQVILSKFGAASAPQ